MKHAFEQIKDKVRQLLSRITLVSRSLGWLIENGKIIMITLGFWVHYYVIEI